jgi:hypothetical protein
MRASLCDNCCASFVSDSYRSVTAAAPKEVGRQIALESFDMMIAPRIRANSPEEEDSHSRVAERATESAVIRSGVTGKIYEFRSLNQEASCCDQSIRTRIASGGDREFGILSQAAQTN